jgi:hypothetical protein
MHEKYPAETAVVARLTVEVFFGPARFLTGWGSAETEEAGHAGERGGSAGRGIIPRRAESGRFEEFQQTDQMQRELFFTDTVRLHIFR